MRWWKSDPSPFDRDGAERPLVRILVHSPSIVEGLAASDAYAQSIAALGHFDFVDLLFTPTDDPKVQEILDALRAETVELEWTDDVIGWKRGSRRSLVTWIRDTIDYSAPVESESRVSRLDWEISGGVEADYFVVGARDPVLPRSQSGTQNVTARQALHLVRLLAVNNGIFWVHPNLQIDETGYYAYRALHLFPATQPAWTLAPHGANPAAVCDQLQSLRQRLGLLCRSADQASYFAHRAPNNTTEDRTIYHLAYFVLLVTGIFDDIAWIANYLWSLDLKKERVVIKERSKGDPTDTTFLRALESHNALLHAFLIDPATRDRIEAFYPLRDQLQHRAFMTGGLLVQNRSRSGIFVQVPLKAHERLLRAAPRPVGSRFETGIRESESVGVDPHWFVQVGMDCVREVVNGALERIDWDSYAGAVPEGVRKTPRIEIDQDGRGVGCWRWGEEPVYLWAD